MLSETIACYPYFRAPDITDSQLIVDWRLEGQS